MFKEFKTGFKNLETFYNWSWVEEESKTLSKILFLNKFLKLES